MVTLEKYIKIKGLANLGIKVSDIAGMVRLSPVTVRRVIKSKSFTGYKQSMRLRFKKNMAAFAEKKLTVIQMPMKDEYPQREDTERAMGNRVYGDIQDKLLLLMVGACGGVLLLLVIQNL